MCPTEIVRAAQQLAMAIRRSDQAGISTWQQVLRSLETSGAGHR